MSVPPVQYHILAGKTAGTKVVTHDRRIVGAHRALVNMARSGNHWARLCVNYINALTSRKMPTVFVREGAKTPDNRQIYVLLVPGLRMEFSQHANSDFVIHGLSLDDSYRKLQEKQKRPGFFRVMKRTDGDYQGELVDRITADKDRVVAISDYSENADSAAIKCARAAKQTRDSYTIDRRGFDMHFTPGEARFGGLMPLKSRSPERSQVFRESAYLLAKTMAESRKVEGVYWITEGGGSGVLTEALRILKAQKVDFKGTDHHVFFSGPTTSLVKAQNLAYDLSLGFERKAYSVGMSTSVMDTIKAPWHRRQKDRDNYSRLQMGVDMCKGGPQLAIGGIAIASSFGLGGAGGFIVGAGVAGFTALTALTKAFSPNTYDRIKGKF